MFAVHSMSDYRAIICGILALAAIIAATAVTLAGGEGFTELLALAGVLAGYIVGLYSSPHDHSEG